VLAGTTNNDEATPSRPAMFNTNIFCQSFIPRPGGQPFRVFPLDELSQWDDTTLVRQRRVTGLAFQGARLFVFFEGSGF
jgi:hypothetical protein